MNQAAQRAIVKTEARRTVKTAQAGSAERTDATGVEGKAVLERRVAGGTKVIGFERSWSIPTVAADRNSRETYKRGLANAAIGGENKRKKSVGDRPDRGSGRSG